MSIIFIALSRIKTHNQRARVWNFNGGFYDILEVYYK